ncbi:MAG: hypothetical protein HRS57_00590 [Mycoplasmataceae bacterium]|nr:hypothetical protein [Mycoplasmataceae bacterium]
MVKIKNFSFNKITKIFVTYLFLLGTITGIIFSFTNYIYKEDQYTNLAGPETTTEFSNNYEFLVEVTSSGKAISDDDLYFYANNLQENLNYLGFHDALVNIEGDDYVNVVLPLYGNSETYTDYSINDTILALKNFLTGEIEVGFYDYNGVSVFDEKGNYNNSGVSPSYLPNMIKPNSAKVVSNNGYTNIEFVPSNGDKGHNAFVDAYDSVGNAELPEESDSSASSSTENPNLMYVWINYDQLLSFVETYDSEGFSTAADLYTYCTSSDDGTSTNSIKDVCKPYLVTVEEIPSYTNPNFKTIEISSPSGTLDKDLVNYYKNQFDISSRGIKTSVVRSGWVDHVYSNQQLVYSFIIFAALILLILLIVISYYGLLGTIISLSSSLIYLFMFLTLFASGVQFSFALSFSVFAFVVISTIMMVYVATKFKERMSWTKKTSTKAFKKTLVESVPIISVYTTVMLISGLFTYLFGYQQIAMIGTVLFTSSLFFIAVLLLVFIPLSFYVLSHFDNKDDSLKDSKYHYILGVITKNYKKSKDGKISSNIKLPKFKNSFKILTSITAIFTVMFIVSASLLGTGNWYTNYDNSYDINTYRYDVLYIDGQVVTSDDEIISKGELESLSYISDSQTEYIVDIFNNYSNVEGYNLSVEESTCSISDIGNPDSSLGGTTNTCDVTRTPSLVIYTDSQINQSELSNIEKELQSSGESYEFSDVTGLFVSDYVVDYSLGNVGIIIAILFVILALLLLTISKWSGAVASMWVMFLQTIGLFVISLLFFVPTNIYFAYAILISFVVSSFIKITYTYQFRREIKYLNTQFKTKEDISLAVSRTSKETFKFTILSYLVLAFGGIVILAVAGTSMLSFAIPLIIASLLGIIFDLLVLPIIISKVETFRQNRRKTSWEKDIKNSKDKDSNSEQLVEGINF